MGFIFSPGGLDGLVIIHPNVYRDARGLFMEAYREDEFRGVGMEKGFVQDNFSHSTRGALRGLHYQVDHPQGKLILVTSGIIYDVAVDLRRGSPTFGRWAAMELSAPGGPLLYIPPGFAHGFVCLSEEAGVLYKCTDYYNPGAERGVRWSDPGLAIEWPVGLQPTVSQKDAALPCLRELTAGDLPGWPLKA